MTPLLELVSVSASYGAIRALREVSLTVERGSVTALLGANGAGKTSTLRCITGLLRPSGGRVSFNGRNMTRARADQIVRAGIAMVPERREVFAGLRVSENLALGAYTRRDRDAVSADLTRVFELFPVLKERQSDLAGSLSGGQQQMLAIGRALMTRPEILLLDEPSLGLAPVFVKQVFDRIREVNADGMTILLVEQNARMALSIADYGYVLNHGEVVISDDAASLAADDRVRRSYLGGI
jgi:branched-chain amino acid transport system ATP-binding protein